MSDQTEHIADGFKMSELGAVPQEWEVVKLGDILRLIRNGLTQKQNKAGDGIPVTRIETIAEEKINTDRVGYVQDLQEPEIRQYRLRDDDVLISHINSEPMLGKAAIYQGSPPLLIHGMNLLLLRVKQEKCHPLYLYYLFKVYRVKGVFIGMSSRAVGQASINQGRLRLLNIVLPPLSEQKAITGVLSAIQNAIQSQDKVIAAARELKKSLMRHLFTYGPVPVADAEKVPLKETEIGPVPEHWQIQPLLSTATLQRGKDLPKQNQVPGPYPIVGSSGLIGYHDTYFCDGPGVVTGRSGSIGKLVYVEDSYWPHNTALYVKDFHDNEPKFIFYMLHLVDFRKYATGVSVPTLNRNFVHSALVPVPPIHEQHEITSMLANTDRKIEVEEKRKSALQTLFQTMLHNLMTGKLRTKDLEVTTA